MRRVLRRQRTVLGRVIRDIERKLADAGEAAKAALGTWLDRAKRLHAQRP